MGIRTKTISAQNGANTSGSEIITATSQDGTPSSTIMTQAERADQQHHGNSRLPALNRRLRLRDLYRSAQ